MKISELYRELLGTPGRFLESPGGFKIDEGEKR